MIGGWYVTIITYNIQLFWIFSGAIFKVLTTQWKQTHTLKRCETSRHFAFHSHSCTNTWWWWLWWRRWLWCLWCFVFPFMPMCPNSSPLRHTSPTNLSKQKIKGVNRRHRDCSANVMNKTDVNQNSNNRSFLNLSKFHNSLLCLPFMATLPLATKFE